jgi:biotin carboxylase
MRRSQTAARSDHHGGVPTALLVLPTTAYRVSDYLEAADALGVEIAVASEEDQALADQMGDRFLRIDLGRPEWSADRIVDRYAQSIDAIVPVDDQGVLVAALAARRLGLAHNPPDAVALTRNKAGMRRALLRQGVPQPDFRVLGGGDDPVALAAEIGLPVVLKPLSLNASRGVIRVDESSSVAATAERVRRIVAVAGGNPQEPILIEEYVAGHEVAVEGLLRHGELEALAVFDKPDPLEGPYFEETMFVTPSRVHPEVVDEVLAVTRMAVGTLGLLEGPVHAELRINGSTVWLVEVAARPIGGLCARSLRFGMMGTTLEAVLLRHALDLPEAGVHRSLRAAGVLMIGIPQAGRLVGVEGVDEALAVEGITGVELSASTGSYLMPVPDGGRYLGFVFASASRPADVEAALRRADALLTVRMEG